MIIQRLRHRLIMEVLYALLISVLLLPSAMAQAENSQKGEIKETVGPMTEPVIRQRLKQLGYTNVVVQRINTLRYQINATKDDKPAILELHPQTGEVHDVTPGKAPTRVWTMPAESRRSGVQP